jgi:hypothetical protein
MPLARIITKHAEEALELAMQLRARGFQVETLSPDQTAEGPADLEIELDACGAEQALARVMEWSSEEISVFVAPGSLSGQNLSMKDFDRIPKYGSPISRQATPVLPDVEQTLIEEPAVAEESFSEPVIAEPIVADPIIADRIIPEPIVQNAFAEKPILEAPVATNELQEEMGEMGVRIIEAATEPQTVLPFEKPSTRAVIEEIPEVAGDLVVASSAIPVQKAPDIVIESRSSKEEPQPSIVQPAEPAEIEPPARADRKPPLLSFAKRPTDRLFWRSATLAAGLAVLVVIAGSAWQQRHPAASALPTPGAQQIPFQAPPAQDTKRTVSPSADPPTQQTHSEPSKSAPAASVATTPPPVAPVAPSPAPATKPVVTSDKKPPASAHRVSQKPKVTQHKAPVHNAESGYVAKDTVIYFDRKPSTTPTGPNSKQ